ncbi:MAG: hypothetical protein WDA13_01970 [Candidatus Shapirobacteria bacterium]
MKENRIKDISFPPSETQIRKTFLGNKDKGEKGIQGEFHHQFQRSSGCGGVIPELQNVMDEMDNIFDIQTTPDDIKNKIIDYREMVQRIS